MKGVILLLSVMCAVAMGTTWTRLNPNIVPSGTHIEKNESHISFFHPDGSEGHFLRESIPAHNPNLKTHSASARAVPSTEDGVTDPASDGWASSFWAWGTSFSYFEGQWSVPPAPTDNAGNNINFFFNSLEGYTSGGGSGADILQPVLQFDNGVGGWTLASWYGTNGAYTESTPIACNPGDTITGIITLTGGNWFVYGYINGNLETTLSIAQSAFQSGDAQNTAQWALEIYNIATCNELPPTNALSISSMYLQDQGNTVTPSWSTPSTSTGQCNAAGQGTSSDSVTITWQSGQSSYNTPVVAAQSGTDFPGNDLSSTSALTAIACASLCDDNSACNAWAFSTGGSNANTCWLKSTASARTNNAQRISGVKLGIAGQDVVGGDLPGMPIALASGSTAATCAAYCQGNGGCVAWSFDTCGGVNCWLKGTQGTWSSSSCRTAGAKGSYFLDHSGDDLSSSVLGQNADASDCQNLCTTTSGCTAWTFGLPTYGCGSPQTCWLKNGLTQPTSNTCRTSGPRTG